MGAKCVKRRAMLTAIGTVAVAGCSASGDFGKDGNTSTEGVLADVPDDKVLSMGESTEYDAILMEATRLKSRSSVEYTNREEEEIKTWDPGDGLEIFVAGLRAENLSNDRLEYPTWDQFQLVTTEGTVDPILKTPDGTSVDEIREPMVSWPGSTGVRAGTHSGWDNVYVAPTSETGRYAVKWVRQEGPIYWRSD